MAAADFEGVLQETVGRDEDPRLPLDRLDQEGDGVVGDRLLERLHVTVRDHPEAAVVRAEVVFVLRLGRHPDDGRGAAVEIVLADDDLRPRARHLLDHVAPLAGGLDGGLDRLGAAVHQERHLHPGEPAEFLAERPEQLVVERARREGDLVRLVLERLHDARVPVPLVERGVGRQHVHVPLPLGIVDPDPLGA